MCLAGDHHSKPHFVKIFRALQGTHVFEVPPYGTEEVCGCGAH